MQYCNHILIMELTCRAQRTEDDDETTGAAGVVGTGPISSIPLLITALCWGRTPLSCRHARVHS
jgi:hypothetical protein